MRDKLREIGPLVGLISCGVIMVTTALSIAEVARMVDVVGIAGASVAFGVAFAAFIYQGRHPKPSSPVVKQAHHNG